MAPATWWPFVAWPALGTAVGVTVGVALTSPGGVLSGGVAPLLVVALAGGAAAYAFRRGRRALDARNVKEAPRVTAAHAPPTPRGAPPPPPQSGKPLTVLLALPDAAGPAADVWGAGEVLRVQVTARRAGAGVAGAAASVTLTDRKGSRREIARGVTGTGGHVDAEVAVPDAGTVTLAATVRAGDDDATASLRVRVVRYADEVRRLVDDLQAWAREHVPECRDALTAREVADGLAGHVDPDALADVLRTYEIVTYGERPADRELYVALVVALARIEKVRERFTREEAPPRA